MAKIRPETQDSSFSLADFVATINADLVNNIGNFVRRCVSLTNKFCDSKVECTTIDIQTAQFILRYCASMDQFKLRDALRVCLGLSSYGNLYLQTQQPRELTKKDTTEAKIVIGRAVMICRVLVILLSPFIPQTSQNILSTAIKTKTDFRFDLDNDGVFSFETNDTHSIPFKKVSIDEISSLV